MRLKMNNRLFNFDVAIGEPPEQKVMSWDKVWLRALETVLGGNNVNDPYTQSEWIYVAIREIAVTIAQIPFKIYKGKKEMESGPIYQLFKQPNPEMGRYQLWESILTNTALEGNAMCVMLSRRGGVPTELWVYGQSTIKPVVDKVHGRLIGWRYQNGNSIENFSPAEVVHFKLYNPKDNVMGLSPVTVARLTMETDYQAQRYNKALLDNNASPSGIITAEEDLTEPQIKLLKKQWESRHKGADNAGKVSVLFGGMKYQGVSLTQKDMEFLQARTMSREALLAIWQVPKGCVGLTDGVNLNTLREQKRIFWQDTLLPYVRMIEDTLEHKFFKLFAPDLRGEFDRSAIPDKEDFKDKIKNAVALAGIGYPINAINERLNLGLPTVPWGNMAYTEMNKIPYDMVGLAPPAPATPIAPAEDEEEETLALPAGDEDEDDDSKRGKMIVQRNVPFGFNNIKWVKFLNAIDPLEKKFASKMKNYFYQQRNILLDLFSKGDKSLADVNIYQWDDQNEVLKRITKPLYETAMQNGFNIVAGAVGSEAFDVLNPLAQQEIMLRGNKITRINETLRLQTVDSLRAGLEQGESNIMLRDRIKHVYGNAKARATTIARTEVVSATNGAEVMAMKEEGIEFKQWLTAGDEAVRDMHMAENGSVVKMGDVFPLTGLEYPSDPQGDAGNVINCRCTIVPITEV